MALRRIGLHAPYVCHRQFHRAFHFELARIASPLVVAGLGQRRQRALRHGQRDIHGLLPSGPGGPSGGCGGWGGFLCFRTRLCLHCHAGSVFGGGHGSALPLVERADGDRLGAMAGQKDRRHGLDSCVNKTPIDGGGCNAGSGVSTLRAFRLAANVAAPGWAVLGGGHSRCGCARSARRGFATPTRPIPEELRMQWIALLCWGLCPSWLCRYAEGFEP